MKIEHIELHHIEMPLVHPFRTSFGEERVRPCILVSVQAQGITGWGECVAGSGPWYSSETVGTAWHIMTEYLIPQLTGAEINTPHDVEQILRPIRGHEMAKAGIELAVWDWFAKESGQSLSNYIGGVRERVPVGVSIGIQPSVADLLERVDQFVNQGYNRVKVKIKPGWEMRPLQALRDAFPSLQLKVDANSAFAMTDVELFRRLDDLNLLMIEQPLAHDDIFDHAQLQSQIETDICLDESIHSPRDARTAAAIGACRVINVKVGRVGGLRNVLHIHEIAKQAGIKLWCGGMLETGIGRAANIHIASLRGFVLPGDISATERYYAEDVTEPFVLNTDDSTMTVPTGPGIGVEVDEDQVAWLRVMRYGEQLA